MNKADIAREDARYIDPNRRHEFIPNDHNRVCYRCDQRRLADIHLRPK